MVYNSFCAYVKDEGSNFNVMIIALTFVFSCESFWLEHSFQGTCFGRAFSKTCQYGTTKERVCKNMKYISIKFVQAFLRKCIIWPKKFEKGRHEWNEACVKTGI